MAKKQGTKKYYEEADLKTGYKSTKMDFMDQRKYSQKEMDCDDFSDATDLDDNAAEQRIITAKKNKKAQE